MVYKFEAIIPREMNTVAMARELSKVLEGVQREMLADYGLTVKTWKNKPSFAVLDGQGRPRAGLNIITPFAFGVNKVEFSVGPDPTKPFYDIFVYVDAGTRPHVIRPKKPGGKLVFKWGGPGSYTAKTQPRVIGSGPSRQTGDIQHRLVVHHPGNKPRFFSEVLYYKWATAFGRRFYGAMPQVARASGHAF